MQNFKIKELDITNIEKELSDIGFDKTYVQKGASKFEYKNIKIYDITPAQGNILKQTALSVGADCATHREVITGNIDRSDCILGGSLSQLRKICEKLKFQPFSLKTLAQEIEHIIDYKTQAKTKIIGILNITKDSFSDGGMYYEFENSIQHINSLLEDGADIIDIGAESTRPGAHPTDEETQLEKIIPVLEYIRKNDISIPISIDTRSSKVAQICIDNGADIINDVSGFDFDSNMAKIIGENPKIKVVIQHSKNTPETMQNNPVYENLIDDIYFTLDKKIKFAIEHNIKKENIIIDPGIGFGKTKKDNFEILKRWKEFKTLGYPIMIGVSRKSLLGMPNSSNEEKDLYTLGLNSILINENVDYIRVHNVKIHKNFINIFENE